MTCRILKQCFLTFEPRELLQCLVSSNEAFTEYLPKHTFLFFADLHKVACILLLQVCYFAYPYVQTHLQKRLVPTGTRCGTVFTIKLFNTTWRTNTYPVRLVFHMASHRAILRFKSQATTASEKYSGTNRSELLSAAFVEAPKSATQNACKHVASKGCRCDLTDVAS